MLIGSLKNSPRKIVGGRKFFPLNKANEAVFWTGFNQLANHTLKLISNLVLTRLLVPEAFGLMVLVNVFLAGLVMFSDFGIRQALVQKKGDLNDTYLNTAWTLQVIRGGSLFAFSLIFSWPFAVFYDQPALFALIPFCAVSALIDGFNPITLAISERNIRLRNIVIADVLAQIATLVITIALSYYFRSVWALAIGSVTARSIKLILNYKLLPRHKHRLTMDSECFSELRKFGQWIFGSTLLSFFAGRGIAAIQGALISIEDLALLSIAGTIGWAPGMILMSILQRAIFPLLSEKNRLSDAAFIDAYNKYRAYIYCICFPIFAILAIFSVPIIELLYDERYWGSGRYLALLALNGALTVVPSMFQCALLSKGYPNIHFKLMSISAFCKISGVFIGFHFFGIYGMIVGIAFSELIMCIFATSFARFKHIKAGAIDIFYLALISLLYTSIYLLYFWRN